MAKVQKLRVAFIHPDLGIGGAEQLVVNLALALIRDSHEAVIYTPYHFKSFPETHDGTIPVKVHGDFFGLLPRSIFGRFLALMAYIRTIVCTLWMIAYDFDFDVVVCDQVSAVVPILRILGYKTIFYCHYPDKLLAPKGGLVKRVYRLFIDLWQELSLLFANKILVNSEFTKAVFAKNFMMLNRAKVVPEVLYPSIDFSKFDESQPQPQPEPSQEQPLKSEKPESSIPQKPYFLSLNRFQRKKNINLALHAFSQLENRSNYNLVIAGGYDPRVNQNVQHHQQLCSLAKTLKVGENVKIMRNITDHQKVQLLKNCIAVLYTPENQHFGIVPCEAMYCKAPVIAPNSGGPTESILHDRTGYLIDQNDKSTTNWMMAMTKLATSEKTQKEMGVAGRERTIELFGFKNFKERFMKAIAEVVRK